MLFSRELGIFWISTRFPHRADHIPRTADRNIFIILAVESPHSHINNVWSEFGITRATDRYGSGKHIRTGTDKMPRSYPPLDIPVTYRLFTSIPNCESNELMAS